MNTVTRSPRKGWLLAAFFVLVLMLTLGPLTLLRSPAPVAHVNGIAVCEPEYNPGPAGMALRQDAAPHRTHWLQLEQNPDYLSALADPQSEASAFKGMAGLLSYDANLARLWLEASAASGELAAVSATVAEAQRLSRDPRYAPCVIR